ncbi:DUF808 domain-containing protein [Azomonas macrocytogenes]|uniref:DUF808 domain-containing protein n=1 Tax=Azomonas macrocytogenes TaxID=69962 RepID=A0A839T1R3_AZOMA|nr:DUF808 domain-containing protein [Azomonas macrocytogenes]MBB3102334.1 hypothetical protein [Azomonas macrocytogenes]
MAGSNLLALIDDIATLLDDISLMTKVAAKKTAGVLGDDLALNAEQVTGLKADRELPVVWAVCKGSLANKVILVPAALLISAFIPWAITPLLMIGGAYLCFEGFEKVAHKFFHSKEEDAARKAEHRKALADSSVDLVALEREKIKGAIRTDFILSAEIVAIALGSVAQAPLSQQVMVLSILAIGLTVGVYGLVAAIVRLDDAGIYLSNKGGLAASLGKGLLTLAPWLMKSLSVIGTVAMFLVGGGILTHGIPVLHELIEHAEHALASQAGIGIIASALPILLNILCGAVAGALVLAVVKLVGSLLPSRNKD